MTRAFADILSDARSWLSNLCAILRSADIPGALSLLRMTALRSQVPIKVRIRSVPIFVRPCTPDLAVARMSFSGEFDAAIAAARPLEHGFIIDAGGYIGTAAIVFARAFPQATILSIEPSRENYPVLVKNTAAYPNVIALNLALGAEAGTTWLLDRGTGQVGFSTEQAPADCARPVRLHEVEVTTVPDLMKRFDARGIDLLKLDVEGAEYGLLKGPPAWLDRTQVVIAELHDRIVPGCEAAFADATAGRRNTVAPRGEKILSIR